MNNLKARRILWVAFWWALIPLWGLTGAIIWLRNDKGYIETMKEGYEGITRMF